MAKGDLGLIEAVSEHVEQYLGPIGPVMHEIVSDALHIDILVVAPTPERGCYTLVTCGMAGLPMSTPESEAEEGNDKCFAELMLCLPPNWPINKATHKSNYWPIYWLKTLARFPHGNQTWFGPGHTIPNGERAEPFAPGTRLGCWLIALPLTVPEGFETLRHEDKTVNFYGLIGLHKNEMERKISEGTDALVDGFDREHVSEFLDFGRPSIFGNEDPVEPERRGIFGLFRRKS